MVLGAVNLDLVIAARIHIWRKSWDFCCRRLDASCRFQSIFVLVVSTIETWWWGSRPTILQCSPKWVNGDKTNEGLMVVVVEEDEDEDEEKAQKDCHCKRYGSQSPSG